MRTKILSLIAICFLAASCSESFLEEEPTSVISQTQLKENAKWNPNIMLGQSLGISATLIKYGTGGTEDHDDFGQKSIDIATDIMSGDMALTAKTYGWFGNDADLQNNTPTRMRTYKAWRYYYRIIKAANEIFDTFGSDTQIPEEGSENRIYFGQAKAMRANSYFNLVLLYAGNYDVSKDKKVLPIYTSQLTAETKGLSTVDQVYDRIITDLKDAITALNGYTATSKDRINADIAKGMLAYAYLNRGDNTKKDYENAALLSSEVIANGNYPLMTKDEILQSGFNNVSIPSWMWAIDLTKDNTAGLPTFWGQVDYFTYSYAYAGDRKVIDKNLFLTIPKTDTRRSWFHSSVLIPWNKFYDNARKAGGNRLWDNDEVFMRVEEMYLINAEANARLNQLPAAATALKELLLERDNTVAATVETMDQPTLLNQIYFNWRLEMWGEGKGLQTMKRFKKSMTRGANNVSLAGVTISYDDPRFIFQIPEREVNNNPNLNK
ncbi:RagB/SusD family nutrient uptake outer membrane protein [uncultured Acetobacteroides sp.]|uniref:RagB/SusD family nutrient uptake outer membrane protein n=1 Tax=uncultured Acetobacteroides sp. TaxID=1760811 RepID=UPI0029F4B028|nr:RagB/SusD family nutrient uptake outer membrane protein [uncultured Acetobacteroides sp.]